MIDLLGELLRAAFVAGIPVAVVTFLVVGWALRRRYFEQEDGEDSLERGLAELKRRRKEEKRRLNPVHDKWLAFGGGFYGIVALITYAVIEWEDVSRIVLNLGGLVGFIRNFNVGIIVEILVESIKNFIAAVTWPVYWLANLRTGEPWLWILVAYGAYWLGLRAARRYALYGTAGPAD